ncbi:hypothetical protein OHAE_5052 [Ochrobactrum soli]|uniref:Uncharacterized protein n=1 Tax=Ochrobactrum soli TaxID=2448455 RepID=A0A2P9HEQ5_9HYPH|nr:hypothetical protein OHAE_5052 [[Ochrobactrum] soli]
MTEMGVGSCWTVKRVIADITVQFTRIPKRSFRFFAANDREGWGAEWQVLENCAGKAAFHW